MPRGNKKPIDKKYSTTMVKIKRTFNNNGQEKKDRGISTSLQYTTQVRSTWVHTRYLVGFMLLDL
jgi:hypothetical protein